MRRKRTEPRPPAPPRHGAGDPSHELRAAIQELELHRAELESQNEALREAQSLLEESRDRYAVLFDFAPLAYVTLGPAGVIQAINMRGAELLGTERARLLGVPFINFVHRDSAVAFRNHITRCRRGGRVVSELTLSIRGRGPVPVELVSVAWGSDDAAADVHTSILDLTDRKQAEQERQHRLVEHVLRLEAERSNRVKDEFLTVLSHELRTPLSAIRGWAYLLRSDSADDLERQHALDVIDRNSHVLTRMINDLLDLSRIERGKLDLQLREVDLTAVIQGCLDSIRPGVVAKGVMLESRIEPSAARLLGDPLRLQQMISNVIANAVKFTPAGGHIEVTVERRLPSRVWPPPADGDAAAAAGPSHYARIRVRDTGIGIEPAELETVFERFHQIDSGTTRRFGGLGLGLSIVRHIAQLHDGRVWAVSGGRGCGTSVFIELPLPEGAAADAAEQDGEPIPQHLHGVRVLVVDDDPDTLDVVTRVLQRLGALVDPVGSAPLAAEMLVKQRPDLLVSDLAMPDEDGYSLIRRVRAGEGSTDRLPAIALTAVAGPMERERALSEGFERFVAKPVDPLELIRVVTELIQPRPMP